LVSITSIPLYFVFQSKLKDDLTWSFYIGASLVIIGIIGEAIADQQLYNYKERVKEERRLAKSTLIG
jgi:steroid 5-alpha reductase family enzyme